MCVSYKYYKQLLSKNLKNCCQLCVDYKSNKYVLKILFEEKFERLIIPVPIESLLYLTPFQG